MMHWILLTVQNKALIGTTNNITALNTPHTSHSVISAEGNYRHTETVTKHVYLVGTVQHPWFYEDGWEATLQQLAEQPAVALRDINGSFSLILVDKQQAAVQIFANRSGGMRLYFHESPQQISISTSLAKLRPHLASTAANRTALRECLDYRWLTGKHSLIDGVGQLQPATFCNLSFSQRPLPELDAYWKLPVRQKHHSSRQQHADNLQRLLEAALRSQIKPNGRVAVLLSGGIDSSLLLALLHHCGYAVVAFSHQNRQNNNPELATAREFAKALGVEHRIIEVDEADISTYFTETTAIAEEPPRQQSALLIYKLFAAMAGEFDHVVYGEAADTMCGSSVIKRYLYKVQLQRKLLTWCLQSTTLAKLATKVLPVGRLKNCLGVTPFNHVGNEEFLERSATAEAWITQVCQHPPFNYDQLTNLVEVIDPACSPLEIDIATTKATIWKTDNNLMHVTSALANHFGLSLITPFLNSTVVNYASQLDDANYLGTDFVKPVLRHISEQFYPKHLLYLPKKGFPAPHKAWLQGPLQPLWQRTQRALNLPATLSNEDVELMWTTMALNVLNTTIGLTLPAQK
jgi:asparagine synthase (glutamine-hydrolysing)